MFASIKKKQGLYQNSSFNSTIQRTLNNDMHIDKTLNENIYIYFFFLFALVEADDGAERFLRAIRETQLADWISFMKCPTKN